MSSIFGIGGNTAAAGAADFYDHQINDSVILEGSTPNYWEKTFSSASDRRTWTFSCWVKRTILDGTNQTLLDAVGTGEDSLFFNTSNQLSTYSNAGYGALTTSTEYRDVTGWMHVVWRYDTTQSTASDRERVYVNGVLQTTSSQTAPSLNANSGEINNNVTHEMGRAEWKSRYPFHGYMAEIVFIDGSSLAPTSFGELKDDVWIPIDVSGLTFGSNGFHLNMADSSDFGNDVSGNNNDWTDNGFTTSDQTNDTPTYSSSDGNGGNFSIINPLKKDTNLSALDEGNLKFDLGTNNRGAICTFEIPLTGKWYYEAYVIAGSAMEVAVGINGIDADLTSSRGGKGDSNCYGIMWSQYIGSDYYARKIIAGTESTGSGALGTTDNAILGVAVNRDDDEIKVYYDNTLLFTNAISSSVQYFPWIGVGGGSNASTFGVFNFGQDGTFAGNKTAGGNADENGYGNFFYSPLSGHLALCAGNLSGDDPTDTTDAPITTSTTFTGNGNADGAIVFLGGVPTAGTINGNTIRFGTDADKLANGLKLRTSSSSYNTSGSNTLEITSTGSIFRFANAQNNL